jgi:hypothetical protein
VDWSYVKDWFAKRHGQAIMLDLRSAGLVCKRESDDDLGFVGRSLILMPRKKDSPEFEICSGTISSYATT